MLKGKRVSSFCESGLTAKYSTISYFQGIIIIIVIVRRVVCFCSFFAMERERERVSVKQVERTNLLVMMMMMVGSGIVNVCIVSSTHIAHTIN